MFASNRCCITKQMCTADFVQQCDLFFLDSHHVPSANYYSRSRQSVGLKLSENMTILGVIFGQVNGTSCEPRGNLSHWVTLSFDLAFH